MGLSCLTDPAAVLVADASTAINLNATGCARLILSALPHRMVMTDVVFGELGEDKRNGRRDAELVGELISSGLIDLVAVADLREGVFEQLVIGAGIDTLDDGEAATIAWAFENKATALIDERKATKICAARFVEVPVGSTLDLFAQGDVRHALGPGALSDAVFHALQDARMRVPARYVAWVVGIIGVDRVAACPSLGRAVRSAERRTIKVTERNA